MNLSHCSKLLFLLPIIATLTTVIEAKTACEGCKDLVDGILKGLDRSKNKNFEGGDVAWEEKKNLKFKTSETRLVEILENVCPKDNFQCNKVLEENDEAIETWYKTMQDDKPLHDYLCIEKASVCCQDDTFGENCAECPKGESNEICFGHGTCEGAGDKAGSGKCICDAGYSGDLCNECADRYFKAFSNDTYTLCTLCHDTCETCTGANATECTSCRAGYREEHGEEDAPMTCVDINECVQQRDLCPVGQYCANTEGSYQCEEWKCHPMCEKCYGPTNANCFSCAQGAIMRHPFICQDIDECASGAICLGMYEVCVNIPGHYKCDCARFFRRDAVSGQCQPDPAIYSRYLPHRAKKDEPKTELPAPEEKKEDAEKTEKAEESENKEEDKEKTDEEKQEL